MWIKYGCGMIVETKGFTMAYCTISKDRLIELYSYDEHSGIFTDVKNGTKVDGWENYGYRHVTIDGTNYRLHRLAFMFMTGNLPDNDIDHINHIRDDNRWCNLREVTVADNNKNLSMNRNNKSGVNGVSWNESRKRWCVYASKNNKTVGLGRYKTLEEAIEARAYFDVENGFHYNHCKGELVCLDIAS